MRQPEPAVLLLCSSLRCVLPLPAPCAPHPCVARRWPQALAAAGCLPPVPPFLPTPPPTPPHSARVRRRAHCTAPHLVRKARVLVPRLHQLPPDGVELLVVRAQQRRVAGLELPPPLLLLCQELQRAPVGLQGGGRGEDGAAWEQPGTGDVGGARVAPYLLHGAGRPAWWGGGSERTRGPATRGGRDGGGGRTRAGTSHHTSNLQARACPATATASQIALVGSGLCR